MHRTAWLVGLVGCYSPSYQSGTPCTSACPGDLVCIDQVCREPGYVPPADGAMTSDTVDSPPAEVDVDGDGLVGAADNCPAVANADQHDEDGDQHGDACDPCPHVAGTLADGDGDGIGDACDPQPQIAKQVLRFFDPFTSDRSEWMHDTGVTRVGEDLRLNGSQFSYRSRPGPCASRSADPSRAPARRPCTRSRSASARTRWRRATTTASSTTRVAAAGS